MALLEAGEQPQQWGRGSSLGTGVSRAEGRFGEGRALQGLRC